MRLRTALSLVPLLLLCRTSLAQLVVIDDFGAEIPQVSFSSADLGTEFRDPFTFLNPNVLGVEIDVILNLVDVPDATSGVQVFSTDGSFGVQSDPGTTSRVFLVYDGMDGDAVRVRASGGLNGVDLTQDGANDHFILDLDNPGPAVDVSFDIFSSLDNRSSQTIQIPAGWSGPQTIPFDGFAPVDNPADVASVNAIIVIVGAGGGSLGPVDLLIHDLSTSGPPPVIPPASGGVIIDQLQTPVGDEWFITDFGGNNTFNAEIQDDFEVKTPGGVPITTIQFDGFYRPSPPPNPTADVVIRDDNNGVPGEVIADLSNMPVGVGLNNLLTVDLGSASPVLPPGFYWLGMQGNVPIGTEIMTRSTPTPFRTPAHWANPGGSFGRNCPTSRPLNVCGSSDQSWRVRINTNEDPSSVDLSITKEVDPDMVRFGERLTFSLFVTNISEQPAPSALVTDRLTGVTAAVATPSQGSCTVSSRNVICDLGELAPGATASITIEASATSTSQTSNTAWVVNNAGDVNPANNSADVSWTVLPLVTVNKVSEQDSYVPGNKIDFDIGVHNTTDATVTDFVVEDVYFTDQFRYVDGPDNCVNITMDVTSTVACQIQTIEPSFPVTSTVTMQALAPPGRATNSTLVKSGELIYGFANRILSILDTVTDVDLSILNFGTPRVDGGTARSKSDHAAELVDLYLGDVKIGEDLAFGQSTGWFSFTLDGTRDTLFIVPADSADVTAAIDTVELIVDPGRPPGGNSSFVVLVDDAAGDASVVVLDETRREATDPGLAEVVVLNAAPDLGPITAFVDIPPTPAILAENLDFGGIGPFVTLNPPGTYNYTVAPPDDGSVIPEVFRVPTGTPGQVYTLVVGPDTATAYNLVVLDADGARIDAQIVTDIEDEPELPTRLALHQNFPNPFSGVTEIAYDIPASAEVSLSLFDVTGRRVAVLDSGPRPAGRHRTVLDASQVAPGVYFYKLAVGDWSATRRLVVVR